MRGGGTVRALLVGALAALGATTAAPALAQSPPPIRAPKYAGFRAVLAQGEGQSVNGADLAAYELTGNPPKTFVNQQPLYVGIMPHAATLTPGDLNVFYRNTTFGQMPGGAGTYKSPKAGVQIFRDGFGMAHIYG